MRTMLPACAVECMVGHALTGASMCLCPGSCALCASINWVRSRALTERSLQRRSAVCRPHSGTVAQRFGRDLLVVALHLLSIPCCRHEIGVAVTLVVGIGGPTGKVASYIAAPLPLGELGRVVAKPGRDHGLRQHVSLRVQSFPVVVCVLVDTAM